MRRTGLGILLACAAMATLLLSSCRKELCYNHWEHSMSVKADIRAAYEQEWELDCGCAWEADWQTYGFNTGYDALRPGLPSGLKVLVYSPGGQYEEQNGAPEGFLVRMSEGEHSLLMYNNDTEYLLFNDLGSTATATVTTRTRTRVPYSEEHRDEITVNAPDMLYSHYVEYWYGEKKLEADILDAGMKPLVFTYYIRCGFSSGAQYIRQARGALSGMAAEVYLKDGSSSEDVITVLFNEEDCSVLADRVEARVLSFGLPGFSGGSDEPVQDAVECFLTLDVELRNGNVKSFKTDVTAQMISQPRGGVLLVDGLVITDEEGSELGGGFDVDVDGWGDYEDVEIPVD